MREYRWDQQNRLVKELHGTHESAYEYDGASRRWRITEKENGTQTKQETFVWCGSRICQKRSGGAVVRSYFGGGFQESGSTKYFYTRDHLGSVREVVGSDGTTVASRLSYDPWGKLTETGSGALSDFTYTGHFYDRATGLNLAQYREYDSNFGRWLSADPIGLRGGDNLYTYVNGDPVNLVDATGHEPGVPYTSGDEAAIAAVEWIWLVGRDPRSIEYSAAIYIEKTPLGVRFFHTDPKAGNEAIAPTMRDFKLPRENSGRGLVHTHPPTVPGATEVNHCGFNDKNEAQSNRLPIYLGAPNGNVTRWDPMSLLATTDEFAVKPDSVVGQWRNLFGQVGLPPNLFLFRWH